MVWSADREVTLTNDLRFDRLTLSVLEWALTGKGRIANMPVTANGFVKTRPELERPDAQCLFQPTSILARPWFPGVKKPEADVVAMASVQLRPEGRGWVRLASADPTQPPRILTNVLSTENDRAFFRRVIPQMREVLATAPLADVVKAELMPGATDDLDGWVRANVRTAMHAAGSCAMGIGPDAVCDAELRVRGLDGLRIADASVMPRIVGGNTNAATIMIGEKAADLIRES
jgi:choline dehydrogenase